MIVTIYNSFSSVNIKPFEFSPIANGDNLTGDIYFFDNGLRLNYINALSSVKDFSINKRTCLFMTDFYKSSDIFTPENVLRKLDISGVKSSLLKLDNTVLNLIDGSLYHSAASIPNITDLLNFETVDGCLMIYNKNYEYLTFNPVDNSLTFKLKIYPNSLLQKFEYFLNESLLTLFPSGWDKQKIVYTSNPLSVVDYNNSTFFSQLQDYTLKLYSFTDILDLNTNDTSMLVRYKNDPITNTESLKIDTDKSESNVEQNHLLMFPYEFQKNNKYPLYIHGLKNYQTPEYDYSNSEHHYGNSSWTRRCYDQIFTGTNQYEGSENVFFGYRAKTQKFKFLPNKQTDFFYPIISPKLSIHDAGFVEDGALGGNIPHISDRLYVHNIDYKDSLFGFPKSINKFDATWACSWLSANDVGDYLWMDRFYNAAYYTLDQALTSGTLNYNPKQNLEIEYNVWDVPSTLYMEPGVRYSYYRIGNSDLSNYVDTFSFDFNEPLGSKLLHFKKWDSRYLKDESPYDHNGIVFNSTDNEFSGDYLTMNGKNHATISTDESIFNAKNFTVNMWLNVDDWSNIQGDQIFGNYYNGGYGLVNSSSIIAPMFTVSENTNGVISTLNYKFQKINTVETGVNEYQKNKIIIKFPNFDYWVFDTANCSGKKYDLDGKLLDVIDSSILTPYMYEISQVEMDKFYNLYIFNRGNKKLVKLNSSGTYITNTTLTGNNIQINLNNELVSSYGLHAAIDGDNNLWEIVGSNLYKNQNIYATFSNVQSINVDAKNNLWVLHNNNKITKLNTVDNLFEFTKPFGNINSVNRKINFLRFSINNVVDDYAVVVDTDNAEAYVINQYGDLQSRLNLKSLVTGNTYEFYADGDFTGYGYIRKFESINKNFSWKFKISNGNKTSTEFKELSASVNNLYKGWHMFSFVFDSTNSTASYYIDSILLDAVYFSESESFIDYQYRSSLLLGAATLKNKTLNDVIGVDDAYKFIGKIADLSIYNKTFEPYQLRNLFMGSNLTDTIKPLVWNAPTGERTYIESVDSWFKMQITGNKSKFFNIKIHNLKIDESLKTVVENSLKNTIKKISPSYSTLNKIEWL